MTATRRTRPRANARPHVHKPARLAVPADRRLRVPVGLPHRRAAGAERDDRVAVRAALRRAGVFGCLLDRGAGGFRLGPYGIGVPGARRYEPGTNIVETTWMTPSGWLVVRDALTIGPWSDSSDPMAHTRPPTDTDADRVLVRTIECIQGSVQVELVCEPAFDYARGEATLGGGRRLRGRRRDRRRDDDPPHERPDARDRGQPRARAAHAAGGREALLRAVVGGRPARPAHAPRRRPTMLDRTSHFWRGWVDDGHFPDHPWRVYLQRSALVLKGLTYTPTGAMVAALTTSLPETPGRRAQLGLPLHVDARRDVHAVGPARARARLGGRRLHAVRRRRRTATATARCRSCTGSTARRT